MLSTEPLQLRLGPISIGILSSGLDGFTLSAFDRCTSTYPNRHRKHALPCET